MYDVIVVGAGHAGIEASMAAARMGCNTLLVTLRKDTIGLMSCNPAIGGVGKGQLVKEIDALGGEMARSADACAIQFRILNSSKGPAVQSTRAQIDRRLYQRYMQSAVERQENLTLKEKEVIHLIIEDRKAKGIECKDSTFYGKAIVIATGTFLGGVIYMGLKEIPAGRVGEPPSIKLSESLKKVGLILERFKTCTTARLDGKTIDFSKMQIQSGDSDPKVFSFSNEEIRLKQLPCYLTFTNEKTHQIIRQALKDKEIFRIISKGVNPRYCPSIEEKVVRFADRDRHQLFIEPEGLDIDEFYTNGLFTFLSEETQKEMISTIPGLENARITKPGYGIEYDFVQPNQLYPNLETKPIRNLFLAGQINGTTGYEEAAAQGLIAGINAALKVKNKSPLILDRSTSYIGVLIDDLVTKGTDEPYRMFTSRVEYRLLLREDNADLRLNKIGFDLGLLRKEEFLKTQAKQRAIEKGINYLKERRISYNDKIVSLYQFLKRPEVKIEELREKKYLFNDYSESILKEIEIEAKYSGFIQRQIAEVRGFKNLEYIKIPLDLDYKKIPGLSREIREKLTLFKPISLGQVSRISGVTPAAIAILIVWLKKIQKSYV